MMAPEERETLARAALDRGPVEVPLGFWHNPPNDLPLAKSYRIQIGQVFCDTPDWIVAKVDDPIAFLAEEVRGVLMCLEDAP